MGAVDYILVIAAVIGVSLAIFGILEYMGDRRGEAEVTAWSPPIDSTPRPHQDHGVVKQMNDQAVTGGNMSEPPVPPAWNPPPVPGSYIPPAPGSHAPPPIPPRAGSPWYRKRWALPVGIGVAGLIIGGIIGGTASTTKTITKDVAGPTVHVTTTATATTIVHVTTTPVKVIATHTTQVRVTYTPPVPAGFSDGTYLVGAEMPAGVYKTDPVGANCYWARLSGLGGTNDEIIANDNITGPTTIQIETSDRAFEADGGCEWRRVG